MAILVDISTDGRYHNIDTWQTCSIEGRIRLPAERLLKLHTLQCND